MTGRHQVLDYQRRNTRGRSWWVLVPRVLALSIGVFWIACVLGLVLALVTDKNW